MRRRSTALAVVLASLGLGACGVSGEEAQQDQTEALESEALYANVGGLKYQVQLSRQLNPRDIEDADYFRELPPAEAILPKGSVWYAVFIRVENEFDRPIQSAEEFEVEDTQGNAFEPIETENVFAYRPETIGPRGYIPKQERVQAYAGTQGSLLLFKIPYESLDNRPLELKIQSPTDESKAALIDLDV